MNTIRDMGNTIRQKLMKSKEIAITMIRKVDNIPIPKFLFHKSLELILLAIMAETFIKRHQLTYFQLMLLIVAIISLSKLKVYLHKHYLEREWNTAYRLLSNNTNHKTL